MVDRWVKIRILVVASLLAVWLVGLVARLGYLHLANHSRLTREWGRELTAHRGAIYDRTGTEQPLAVNLPAWRVYLDPKLVNPRHDRVRIASRLAGILGLDTDLVLVNLKRTDSRYIPLAISLDDSVQTLLTNKAEISGVAAEELVVRRYPQGRRMAHVLGFTNKAGMGSAGVEQRYERYLRGSSGCITGAVDAFAQEIRDRRELFVSPIDGATVHLTLDASIQYVVERELADVVARFGATGAWAIVQRVRTGEILAMASLPDFDPNEYNRASCATWRNQAIATVYEPGSTLKSVAVSAALNEGLVTPETLIDIGMGPWYYAGRPLRDHVDGVVSVATILKKSSNKGAARIALMLGNRRFEAYLHAFGLGAVTGLDLPGEEKGLLAPSRDWSMLSPTRIAIGQGVAVTAIQLLGLYCTIANDGRMMRPYVVDRILSPEGVELYRGEPQMVGRPIRPATAAAMRAMLSAVTEEGGTAARLNVPGFRVAGKTGTAQIPGVGGYSETDFWASFVGFLPAEDPEFGAIVVVERPQPQHTGGFVAAPVFGRIAEAVAQYLEIPATPLAPESESAAGTRLAAAAPTPTVRPARGSVTPLLRTP